MFNSLIRIVDTLQYDGGECSICLEDLKKGMYVPAILYISRIEFIISEVECISVSPEV